MITFAIEKFSDVYAEMFPLLEKHYDEISVHKERGFPLAPQVEVYKQREREGSLLMIIGRERGQIAAYLVAFVTPGLHYKTCLSCAVDIFFVTPDARGAMNGVKMLQFTKQVVEKRGVKRWTIGEKVAHPAARLFKRIGFQPVEVIHELWL